MMTSIYSAVQCTAVVMMISALRGESFFSSLHPSIVDIADDKN